MSLLTTILTGGRPGPGRVALWAKNLIGSLLLHPFKTVRLLLPFRWARECVILLCMQALEGHIDMRWERHVYWPFRKFLVSRGHKVPTFIPAANEFAEKFAQRGRGNCDEHAARNSVQRSRHGTLSGWQRHCRVAGAGVVDYRNRVFGYRNMYVCDGSVVAANLGVNPSLTITALTERAMSFIPPAPATAWNDEAEMAAKLD